MSTIKKTVPKSVKGPEIKVWNPKAVIPKKKPVAKSTVQLISFSIKATIPVMTFGNVQPEVVVKAKTIEEAQAYALPIIEALFQKYCESPRDGSSKPSFISKAAVTVKETVVHQPTVAAPVTPAAPKAPVNMPVAPAPVSPQAQATRDAAEAKDPFQDDETPKQKSAPYEKGEKAIGAAMSLDALNMIEDQIQNSVKLMKEEKQALLTVLLKRRKDFK